MSTYPNQFARTAFPMPPFSAVSPTVSPPSSSPPKTTFTTSTPLTPMLPAWSIPATTTRAPRA